MKNEDRINIKLAGFLTFYSDYLKYFKLNKVGKEILKKYNISLYDGPSNCKWNGGRLNRSLNTSIKKLKVFNSINIGIYYTFTNNIIDLTDDTGNFLLSELETNNINGIISINDELNKYLKNFNLKQVCSIIKHDHDVLDIEYYIKHYQKLEKLYDIIVIRSEHALNNELIKHLNIKQYEVLINDNCTFNCPIWKEHFDAISKNNRTCSTTPELIHEVEECPLIKLDNNSFDHNNSRGSDNVYIKQLLAAGFINFKIAGRESKFENIIELLECF